MTAASPFGTATVPTDRAGSPALLAELRLKLAESERELLNPILFTVTRRCICQRISRLRWEIAEISRQLGEPGEGSAAL